MRKIFETVRLRGRRLYFDVLQGHIVGVASKPPSHIDHIIERLAITTDEERLEGDVLHVGAWGLTRIVNHLHDRPSYHSKSTWERRMNRLFGGEAHLTDMRKATIRASLGLPDEHGEAAYFTDIARRQLAWRPQDTDEIEIEIIKTTD